ncbi:HAMP domain-containing sensor histidine kinase [Cytophagales bacterium LB-30]|uniref:histidine kinase n=1 Tax=Shiella aurantiaca TaxID=3058365 RepID=A0ABT8F585_9BACT|nr:HAMP domain-containing sensor histidine kinase [Shiella aurantiaca]MDN4165386.1 HAMP domain-containing sensor histidine kinase [Shiella aurantiaca]
MERPWVKISVAQNEKTLTLRVHDNGQGIPKGFEKKIFSMFFRGNEKSQGSGLGLFILNSAVERLKGSVSVESEAGRGSIFTVVLPV